MIKIKKKNKDKEKPTFSTLLKSIPDNHREIFTWVLDTVYVRDFIFIAPDEDFRNLLKEEYAHRKALERFED